MLHCKAKAPLLHNKGKRWGLITDFYNPVLSPGDKVRELLCHPATTLAGLRDMLQGSDLEGWLSTAAR